MRFQTALRHLKLVLFTYLLRLRPSSSRFSHLASFSATVLHVHPRHVFRWILSRVDSPDAERQRVRAKCTYLHVAPPGWLAPRALLLHPCLLLVRTWAPFRFVACYRVYSGLGCYLDQSHLFVSPIRPNQIRNLVSQFARLNPT